jgi:hypothetical protein
MRKTTQSSGSEGYSMNMVIWRHLMRQNLRVCRHQKPFPGKAKTLLGDMETFLRHYFSFFFLDMIIIHANASISSKFIVNFLIDIVRGKNCKEDCGWEIQ